MDSLGQLKALIARHAGDGVTRTMLDGVVVMSSDTTTDPLGSIAEPVLAVVAQGVKETVLGERVFAYGAGQFLVVPVDVPVTAHISHASAAEPFLGFGLVLEPAAIAALLLESAPGERGPARPARIAISDASPAMLDAIVRLLGLLDHPEDVGALAPAFEREILWRLVTSEQGTMVRQIGLADSRLSHVGRAIHWIRHHYAETLRVEDLASLSAMSVSSFHRHFRAVTEMTPIQFQKQIRLQEARTRLIAQPRDVAGVGFAVGYDSASQFSREYRRRFGIPPGQDAAHLREAAAPRRGRSVAVLP
ncbi:MAG: Bacterial regulatory helix-turn-helix s, AraC family protein [Solirubrobacterales bacterium]|nr:Bacterial regulatory helix-turn-helix s, AraC family protein [Solirubrobacterales bacterium]